MELINRGIGDNCIQNGQQKWLNVHLLSKVCPHFNLYSFNASDFLTSVLAQCPRVDLRKEL